MKFKTGTQIISIISIELEIAIQTSQSYQICLCWLVNPAVRATSSGAWVFAAFRTHQRIWYSLQVWSFSGNKFYPPFGSRGFVLGALRAIRPKEDLPLPKMFWLTVTFLNHNPPTDFSTEGSKWSRSKNTWIGQFCRKILEKCWLQGKKIEHQPSFTIDSTWNISPREIFKTSQEGKTALTSQIWTLKLLRVIVNVVVRGCS